jgi:hypothetical protein
MAEAIELKLLDKRVAQRYLRKGRLDEKEYQKHVQSLPDLADQALEIDSTFEPSAAPRPQSSSRVEPGIDASEE